LKVIVEWMSIAVVAYLSWWILRRIGQWLLSGRTSSAAHEVAEDVANASKVGAAVTALCASIVAPAGLAAVGAFFGLISIPLIVRVAPIVAAIALAAAALSAAMRLHSKRRRKKVG